MASKIESSDELARKLETIDFHHPFTPYNVQLDFMKTVYRVLETGSGQVGILESPTGTGKSLSLICASLTWLRHHKSFSFESSLTSASQNFTDEPPWLVEQLLNRQREELVEQWREREIRLQAVRMKEKALEEKGRLPKRRRIDVSIANSGHQIQDDEEAEWLLDEAEDPAGANDRDPLSGLSKESRDVLASVGLGGLKQKDQDEPMLEENIKIYYTSRTHSQLSQFITELRRPAFPSSLPASLAEGQPSETVKLLPLSSRQKLCINSSVSSLKSVQAINDRCAELQQAKSKKRCDYVPRDELLGQTHQFRDSALATVPDIEDLHQLGKSLAVCPYYASRTALPGAEIITLPYPLLLQKSAREALGIKLEGSVVIIDEAHNIMDAVANVHSSEIKMSDLRKGRGMLGVYVKRFGKKLKGTNRVSIGRVGRVIDGLIEWIEKASKFKEEQGIVDSNDLLRSKGIDQINMFELISYIQESKLAFKIEGYAAYVENQDDSTAASVATTPVLHLLVSFLVSLTNLSSEGRIFYQKLPSNSKGLETDMQLSYLLLSPTYAFSSIAASARAIILAGGTMSPFADYIEHLFPSVSPSQISTLSCDHVIPKENICVWALASSQSAGQSGGADFEFSFQKRGDKNMIHQLGLAILNICTIVPDGVVAFFPSYGYLDEVVKVWQTTLPEQGRAKSIWERLAGRKAVFQETKGASSEETLAAYSAAVLGEEAVKSTNAVGSGALLLSVVGGKMSEGINFSDRLGRCVLVIGLPYPNIGSPEWKAKMEFIESATVTRLTSMDLPETQRSSTTDAKAKGKQASRDFYENACMRAVNQSIGRAIRHRGDYASIVLVDRRYGTERIKAKLPGWIRGGIVAGSEKSGLPDLMAALGKFFRSKRST